MRKKEPQKENKKVINAKPNEYEGIKFKSKLETYTYKKLKEAGISAEYEPTHFELIPKFIFDGEFEGEKVRAMTYKPDFVGDNFIIECKGMMTDSFPLRWKIFKYVLYQAGSTMKLYMVRNMKQVDKMVDILKKQIDERIYKSRESNTT